MKKIGLMTGLVLFVFFRGTCQEQKQFPLLLAVTNNATLMPGHGYLGFTVPVHPGLSVGTQKTWKEWKNWQMDETFRIGSFYHQYSELAFELYSELIFPWKPGAFAIEPQIQAGYMLAFPDLQVFEYDGDEYVEKAFKGRSQFIGGAGLGFSYTLNHDTGHPVKLSLAYLVNLQMPYIKNYAPVLIISTLQAGVMFYVPCKKKNANN
jgi:hypothetical protein